MDEEDKEEGPEELIENDELSPEEEAFMRGYDEAEEPEEEEEEKEEEE